MRLQPARTVGLPEKAFTQDLLRFELRQVEEHELEEKLEEANQVS